MAALRALLLILIAATLVVGGTARAMPATTAEPPCHEAPAQQHHDKSKPAPQAAMHCCVGCMPAPNMTAADQLVVRAERPSYAPIADSATGRLTAPEPDPPRLRA